MDSVMAEATTTLDSAVEAARTLDSAVAEVARTLDSVDLQHSRLDQVEQFPLAETGAREDGRF